MRGRGVGAAAGGGRGGGAARRAPPRQCVAAAIRSRAQAPASFLFWGAKCHNLPVGMPLPALQVYQGFECVRGGAASGCGLAQAVPDCWNWGFNNQGAWGWAPVAALHGWRRDGMVW